MSSTSNVQNLLVNVVRPTYRWESGTGFLPSVVVSNVTELIAGKVITNALVVSDSNVNTFIGSNAGCNATTSFNNVGIGLQAMAGVVNSDSNVAVGTLALEGFSNGSNNTVIGAGADIATGGNSNIIIGTNTQITGGSNSIVIGNGITWSTGDSINIKNSIYGSNGRIGIGTVVPSQPLDVSGLAYFRDKVGIQISNPTYSLDVLGTVYATTRFLTGMGSASIPSFTFSNDASTGLHSAGTSQLAFATAGVRRMVISNGNVGIGTAAPAYALDICGTIRALEGLKQGTNTWGSYSDRRVKHDIHTADTSLCYSIIKRLPLKRFTWDTSLLPTIKDKTSVGWIAQDVEQVFPRAVAKTAEFGMDDLLVLDVDQIYKTMYGALEKVIADKEALEAKLTRALARIAALETALDISYAETVVDVSSEVTDVSGASLQSSELTPPTLPTPPPPEEPPVSEPEPQPQPSSEYAPAPEATEA